jgi:hypothetical protein
MTAEPRLESPTDSGATFERDLLASQIRLLMNAWADVPTNLVNATLVTAVLWTLFPPWLSVLWLALVYAVTLGRVLLRRAYRRAAPGPGQAPLWARRWTAAVFAQGCLWGLVGTAVLMTNSPILLLFILFVLGGMTAGGLVSNAAYLPAAYAYVIPVLTPAAVCLSSQLQATPAFMVLMLHAAAGKDSSGLLSRREREGRGAVVPFSRFAISSATRSPAIRSASSMWT